MRGLSRHVCAFAFQSFIASTCHAAEPVTVQFCWTLGLYDQTAYFAEATDRPDRSQDFSTLLDISAVEHGEIYCVHNTIDRHADVRRRQLQQWRDSELDIVNTTFMNDSDN